MNWWDVLMGNLPGPPVAEREAPPFHTQEEREEWRQAWRELDPLDAYLRFIRDRIERRRQD